MSQVVQTKGAIEKDHWLLFLSGGISLFLLYLIFLYQPKLHIRKSVPVGVITTDGLVRRRQTGTLHWESIEGTAKVHMRDMIYTAKGVTAVIEFNNHERLVIAPESLIQLDENVENRIQITLFEGTIKQALQVKVMAPSYEVSKAVSPPFSMKLMPYLPSLTQYEIRSGELRTKAEGYLKNHLNLTAISKESIEMTFAPLNRLLYFEVVLKSPPTGAQIFHQESDWIQFEWSPVPLPNVTYEIQFSKDHEFHHSLNYDSKSSQLSVQFVDASTYFWRVLAKYGEEEVFSDISSFTHLTKDDRFRRGLSKTQTEPPSGNLIEISSDKNFKTLVKSFVTQETKCTTDELPKGVYYCRLTDLTNKTSKVYLIKGNSGLDETTVK